MRSGGRLGFPGAMRPWPWLLPFAIAAAITVLSHSPAYPMDVQLPPPLDKAAHLLAFGTLAAAADWAWTRTVRGVPAHRRQLLLFLAACLFGGIDELHQSFVPGRMANNAYGTQSPTKLNERGINAVPHYDDGKHLYWRALNRSGRQKSKRLGLLSMPYPKPDAEASAS